MRTVSTIVLFIVAVVNSLVIPAVPRRGALSVRLHCSRSPAIALCAPETTPGSGEVVAGSGEVVASKDVVVEGPTTPLTVAQVEEVCNRAARPPSESARGLTLTLTLTLTLSSLCV